MGNFNFNIVAQELVLTLEALKSNAEHKGWNKIIQSEWNDYVATIKRNCGGIESDKIYANITNIVDDWAINGTYKKIRPTYTGNRKKVVMEKDTYLVLIEIVYDYISRKEKIGTSSVYIEDFVKWIEKQDGNDIRVSPLKIAYSLYYKTRDLSKEKYLSLLDDELDKLFVSVVDLSKTINIEMFEYLKKLVQSKGKNVYFSKNTEGGKKRYAFFVNSKKDVMVNITPLIAKKSINYYEAQESETPVEIFTSFCWEFFACSYQCNLTCIDILTMISYESMHTSQNLIEMYKEGADNE